MKRNRISEATGSGNAGHFKVPIVLSPQPWTEDQVAPFTNPVYSYNNAELAYEPDVTALASAVAAEVNAVLAIENPEN